MGAGNTQGGVSQPAVPSAFGSSAEPRNPAMLPDGNSSYMTGEQSGAKYPGQEGYFYPDRVQSISPRTGRVSQNQAGARWTTRRPPNNSYNWAPGQFDGLMQGIAQLQQQMQAMTPQQVAEWNAQNFGPVPGQSSGVYSQAPPQPYSGMGFTGQQNAPAQPRPTVQPQPYPQQQFNPFAMGMAQNPYLLYALMASMGGIR